MTITDDDVYLFDLLTQLYRNFALIRDLTYRLDSEIKQDVKGVASRFYFSWCDYRLEGRLETPFNVGTVWMLSSVIIVTSRERWLDYLPETPLSESDPEWGLKNIQLCYPSDPDPSIRKVVKKIRNSIAHSDLSVIIGKLTEPLEILFRDTVFTFRDSEFEYFELVISMSGLSKLIASVYITIEKKIEQYMSTR